MGAKKERGGVTVESIEENALAHLARSLEQVGVQVETIDIERNLLRVRMDPGDDVHVCGMAENVAGRWGLSLHTEASPTSDGVMEVTVELTRKTD
jgi:hypothetical protein